MLIPVDIQVLADHLLDFNSAGVMIEIRRSLDLGRLLGIRVRYIPVGYNFLVDAVTLAEIRLDHLVRSDHELGVLVAASGRSHQQVVFVGPEPVTDRPIAVLRWVNGDDRNFHL